MGKPSEKSGGAFRTIREVADWLGVPTHVLRFWESKFEQIAPVKGAGGRRYYRPEDMRLLGGIKVMLHDDGLTIRAVVQRIEEDGVEAIMDLSPELEPVDGPPQRTRRVIRKGDGAPAKPDETEPPQDDPPPPVEIAKEPATPLEETLPDQPGVPDAVTSSPDPEPTEELPEAPAPEPSDDTRDAHPPGVPEDEPDAAPADPGHQVRHSPDFDPHPAAPDDRDDADLGNAVEPPAPDIPAPDAPTPDTPAPTSPDPASDGGAARPITRARHLAAMAPPLDPPDRKRLRRLVRRYRALAEEIADDLSEGPSI